MNVTEKTNFKVNIATLATILIFMLGIVWSTAECRMDFESRIGHNEKAITKTKSIVEQDHEVINSQKGILIRIQTDLLWIREKMSEDNK